MLSTNAPIGGGGLALPHAAPQWTPPPPLQGASSQSAMGLPDFTTDNSANGKAQKEWSNDACITIALIGDTVTSAYWLEKQAAIKSVWLDNSKRIAPVVGIPASTIESIKRNEGMMGKGLLFGKDAVSAHGVELVFPLALFSDVPNKKSSKLEVHTDKGALYVKLTENKLEVQAVTLLNALLFHVYEAAIKGYQEATIVDNLQNEEKKKSKSKKSRSRTQSITLIVPSFAGCEFRAQMQSAVVSKGTTTTMALKNIFGHGLASVMGALLRPVSVVGGGKLVECLLLSKKVNPVVLFVHASSTHMDVSLVNCEGLSNKSAVTGSSIPKRLASLAASGEFLAGNEKKESLVSTLSAHITKALSKVDLQVTDIDAIVFDGIEEIILHALKLANISTTPSTLLEALDSDASQGGALLSAAELDSSKEYVQDQDGNWSISYMFPVGDESLVSDIGIYIESNKKDEKSVLSNEDVEVIFKQGTRISKTEVGPLIPGKTNLQKEYQKKFVWGSTLNAQSSKDYTLGYPKVLILERRSVDWKLVRTLTPLQGAEGAIIESTVTLRISPSEGTVSVHERPGESVVGVRGNYWMWIKVLLFLFGIISLIGGVYLYYYLSAQAERQAQEDWLREFYWKYAPEKLQEKDLVSRTIQKYEGKLFLLWRKLEKTYNVKYRAPESIKEL